jgi:hypothetical protein
MKKPKGGRVSPEFPPKEAIQPLQVRLPVSLWATLRAIAKAEDRPLNEVIHFFLKWAVDDYLLNKEHKGRK